MVTEDYWEQFLNWELLKMFYNKPLSEIEAALKYYENKYQSSLRVGRRNNTRSSKLPTGNSPHELFNEVKEVIDQSLSIKSIGECEIVLDKNSEGSAGEYDPELKTISIGFPRIKNGLIAPKAQTVIVLAHEYGHHVFHQTLRLIPPRHFRLLDEGIAYGVERIAAERFLERYSSRGFQHFSLMEVIDGLEFACSVKKQSIELCESDRQASHLGHAIFAVLEAERGQDIYRQILHGGFRW